MGLVRGLQQIMKSLGVALDINFTCLIKITRNHGLIYLK